MKHSLPAGPLVEGQQPLPAAPLSISLWFQPSQASDDFHLSLHYMPQKSHPTKLNQPVKSQDNHYSGYCFKPLSFQVLCYEARDYKTLPLLEEMSPGPVTSKPVFFLLELAQWHKLFPPRTEMTWIHWYLEWQHLKTRYSRKIYKWQIKYIHIYSFDKSI